jgi:hypothetical protein
VGITQLPPPAAQRAPTRAEAFITGGAYAVLFLLGLVEGVLGSFQYSRAVFGGVPLAAIGFALGIGITCGLAGWAMGTMLGALVPAIGWFLASFGLAMPVSAGSVIIANTTAGEWYLYGGAVCALLGIGSALVTTGRSASRFRAGRGGGSRA